MANKVLTPLESTIIMVEEMKSYNPRHPREIETLLFYIGRANELLMREQPSPAMFDKNCSLMRDRRRYSMMLGR
ncbi:MAG: hypothetical protein LBL46_01350 [Rickettsiales bacterium]|jgi:hypothetical protein|nr:hypothetical protein [Rickettsiales bacterium]